MLRFNDIADRMLEYNPGVDLHKVRPGTVVQIPVLTPVERG